LAATAIAELCRAATSLVPASDAAACYEDLNERERAVIARRMAGRGVADPRAQIADGRFWDYADGQTLKGLFRRRPELFFDGNYWDDPYVALDFGDDMVTDDARQATVAKYDAYLTDAIWLSEQTPGDLDRASRDTIIRAVCSLRLLRPDAAV
jgi:hypothetical protein